MFKPEEYTCILAWHQLNACEEWYIKKQQNQASKENAPINAIYKSIREDRWIKITELHSQWVRNQINQYLPKEDQLLRRTK